MTPTPQEGSGTPTPSSPNTVANSLPENTSAAQPPPQGKLEPSTRQIFLRYIAPTLISTLGAVGVAYITLFSQGKNIAREGAQDELKRHATPPPIGTIICFAGNHDDALENDGWLLCNGKFINKDKYPDLYKVIGTQYGSSNTNGEFRLPNLVGRYPVGASDDCPLTKEFGQKEFRLEPSNIPQHTHVLHDPGHMHTARYLGGTNENSTVLGWIGTKGTVNGSVKTGSTLNGDVETTGITIDPAGNLQVVPITLNPPSVALNFLIKAKYPESVK